VVVAFGGVETTNYWPTFFQLPSFAYLTGFGEPDAALVLVKRAAGRSAALFVPPRNLRTEKYVGARTGPAEAERAAGIPGRPLAELRPALDSLLAAGLPLHVVSDVQSTDYAEADTLTRGARLVADLRRARPGLAVRALDTAVHALRARKSPAEVALLRRAARSAWPPTATRWRSPRRGAASTRCRRSWRRPSAAGAATGRGTAASSARGLTRSCSTTWRTRARCAPASSCSSTPRRRSTTTRPT
jgi:hypothetical protein